MNPRKLCEALVEGINAQKKWDAGGVGLLADGCHLGYLGNVGFAASQKMEIPKEEEDSTAYLSEALAWDDVSGAPLNPGMVKATGLRKSNITERWACL